MFELLFTFGVEKFPVGIKDRECRNALSDGDVVPFGDIDVFIHLADVDMNQNKVFLEEFSVGTLMVVDVENLAIAAPVAPEVEQNSLVFAVGADESGGDVRVSVGGLGV